ncbi:hypothetical protein Q4E93_01965 [Flavitalea sp. BT771]|uniref:hypothetical protein n=1 Tax=Flavitalea sp. BT771 TaxID=3063329 RepID=UPI0026E36B82|nr:hypothetical protein [Flavitalea sp. BT771]MDO6429335.1 hypothetical protein [Flavitalea sp. BT771]MDV6218537.1 hypothetical protein [Flavitalea sp. BT771]
MPTRLRAGNHNRLGNQSVFRDRDAFRHGAARVLEQDNAPMCLRMIRLDDRRTCGFVGSIKYKYLLAGGELHAIKVNLLVQLHKGTYEQVVYIADHFNLLVI